MDEKKQDNDYHKKKRIAKKNREVYIFNGIKRVMRELSPGILNKYYERFPYEEAEKIARKVVGRQGIYVSRWQYQKCLEDIDIAYLYTICRCAYRGYDYIECYFKRMMKVVSIWSFYLDNEVRDICIENNLRPVYIDGDNGGHVQSDAGYLYRNGY